MPIPDRPTAFSAEISAIYERHLVPLIFEPYAEALATRVARIAPSRVLEIAAGTGALTRALASTLPAHTSMVATDLSPAMLATAAASGARRSVRWQVADAHHLPFAAGEFDVVVCQFGAMFFDKPRAFAEARRVLRPGGAFLFSVWDRIEENEFADVVTTAVRKLFPDDPPCFVGRIPHGYHDRATIEQDLADAGFTSSGVFATLTARSRAPSPMTPALAFCLGTPLRNEIEARDASRLDEATATAAEAIRRQFGDGPVDGRMSAHFVSIVS